MKVYILRHDFLEITKGELGGRVLRHAFLSEKRRTLVFFIYMHINLHTFSYDFSSSLRGDSLPSFLAIYMGCDIL